METTRTILETKGNGVAVVDRNATVHEAASLMSARKIGALVVTAGEKVVGIFTERDILNKVVVPRRVSDETRVGEVMTSPVACCRRDTTLSDCRAIMTRRGVRHLPVVENGRLYGLISSRDVIAGEVVAKEVTIDCLERTIDELNEYLYTVT
ncbi:MAG: CBS domain-containing protein [Planctomycetota bacterium]